MHFVCCNSLSEYSWIQQIDTSFHIQKCLKSNFNNYVQCNTKNGCCWSKRHQIFFLYFTGRVATCPRCGGSFNDNLIKTLLLSQMVKDYCGNWSAFQKPTGKSTVATFFHSRPMVGCLRHPIYAHVFKMPSSNSQVCNKPDKDVGAGRHDHHVDGRTHQMRCTWR